MHGAHNLFRPPSFKFKSSPITPASHQRWPGPLSCGYSTSVSYFENRSEVEVGTHRLWPKMFV